MKIAILSREPNSYSTKRLVAAIKEAGHTASVLNHARCYVEIERNNPGVYYNGNKITGIDVIIPRIGASYTAFGSAVVRQFEMMNVFSSVSSLALVRSRDKLRSLQLLARAGIGIPKTIFARQGSQTVSTDDLIELVGGAPVIVKLIEGTMGRGVVLAETRKAAKSLIEAFYGLGASFLVQEFIREAGGGDIRAFVIGDKVVGAMQRQSTEMEFRSNLHRGGTASAIELSAKERNIAVKAAHTLGLQVAGVDILRSDRGPLVLEVNSSPGLEGIENTTGLDIAGAIVRHAVDRAGGKRRRDRVGA